MPNSTHQKEKIFNTWLSPHATSKRRSQKMVENRKLGIKWDKAAKTQLKKAYNQIKEESLQGAETVRMESYQVSMKYPMNHIVIPKTGLK